MTEREALAELVALHKRQGQRVYEWYGIRDDEEILSDVAETETDIIENYLLSIAVANIVERKWIDGTNYRETVKTSVERTRADLEDMRPVLSVMERKEAAEAARDQFERRRNYETKQILVTEDTRVRAETVLGSGGQYMYIADLDDRTCELCRGLAGQIFEADEARIGENCPPMHAMCRCRIKTI